MIIGKVIDTVWATRKVESLRGLKFMLVEELYGKQVGRKFVAADQIGAGIGERVLVSMGSSGRKIFADPDVPVDAVVIGIIDEDCTFSE